MYTTTHKSFFTTKTLYMKNILLSVLTLGTLLLFQACEVEEAAVPVSKAEITVAEENGTVTIAPGGDAVSYEYAFGPEMTMEDFISGESERISVQGSTVSEIDLSELSEGFYYSFFAVAYDAKGNASAVSSLSVPVFDDGVSLETSWITATTAGFVVNIPSFYYSLRYHVGADSDREAFYSGEIAGSKVDEPIQYAGVNCFELKPGTDYVLFVEAIDRSGFVVKKELQFTTEADDESTFAVDYKVVASDAYMTQYQVSPVGKTEKVGAFALSKLSSSTDNLVMYGPANGRGHLVNVFKGWLDIDFNFKTAAGVLDYATQDPEMNCNVEVELYLLAMDASDNIKGIYKYDLLTAEVDENAGAAEVSVEVSDVTSVGATYTYTPNSETMAFMYDTIEADWFDEFSQSSEYDEYYLHNRLFAQGYYFAYGQDVVSYTEEQGTPGTRYYAAACPLNVNGPKNNGWGKLSLKEYTTDAE